MRPILHVDQLISIYNIEQIIMREILLWIYFNIMPSAETILVIDVPMRSSRDLGRDTFTITPMSGPMHLS